MGASSLTKRTEKHLRRASVDWHVDETYIRVGGKWRYLWRAIERVRLHRPVTICTDKAHAYRRAIRVIDPRAQSADALGIGIGRPLQEPPQLALGRTFGSLYWFVLSVRKINIHIRTTLHE